MAPTHREKQHPDWIDTLPMAVWIVGEDGRIIHLNDEAVRLLGREPDAVVGHPCHEVIGGRCPDGSPLCSKHCPVVDEAVRRGHVDTFDLDVATPSGPRRLTISVGVVRTREGRGVELVHLAADVSRGRRAESFVRRLAHRSGPEPPAPQTPHSAPALSTRELTVLRLLARDETLEEIAATLGVSYATVRNHVQHILRKLGAHSMLEAIARFVLDELTDEPPDDSGRTKP